LPEDRKDAFFYRLWTRKESFVKAVGIGVGLDVSRVVSSLVGAARFLSVPEGAGRLEIGRWSIWILAVALAPH